MVVACLLGGCDHGTPDLGRAHGPDLKVVATYPLAGQGLECTHDSLDDCGVPAGTNLELRFNRFLDPATATRQSVNVYTGTEDLWVFLRPRYDLLERVVVYELALPAEMQQAVRYNVRLPIPTEDDGGFRAFDGAPLTEQGSADLDFSFRFQTGPVAAADDVETTPECATAGQLVIAAEEVFTRGGCASAVCHQPTASVGCGPGYARASAGEPCVGIPRMGLDLSSIRGILATAIGQVAHQTETGASSGVTLENPDRFGVQMPIIDPGRPGNSYLLYKLLLHPAVFSDDSCTSAYDVRPAGPCPTPPSGELLRLGEWFVLGGAMPADTGSGLRLQDLRTLQAWIQAGAPTTGCP